MIYDLRAGLFAPTFTEVCSILSAGLTSYEHNHLPVGQEGFSLHASCYVMAIGGFGFLISYGNCFMTLYNRFQVRF